MAIVGTAGGEFGIRGFIEATDLNTGKALWRTYTIPGTGEPGNETWKDGKERWKHGGGSVWETATYDPETDTFYQGIGNAGPDWDPEYRPGDNKWAASVLAINASDGKIKWGYQYTPNDPYDFDEISEHPIINAKVNGEDRKLVVHAARNGFFYALDRVNGSFIAGKQYVDQLNWTAGLDPKTGSRSTTIPQRTFRFTIRAATACALSRRATSCARRTSAARTGSPPPIIPNSA
jgi:alcohol dehydrogenase (cytochrome c)